MILCRIYSYHNPVPSGFINFFQNTGMLYVETASCLPCDGHI